MNENQGVVKYNLKDQQKNLKSFLQFVGKTPDAQNAVFLLYNDSNSSPEKLFNSYKSCIQSKTLWTGMFSTLTKINNKTTVIYALDRSFLSLKDDGSNLSDKDLILLYLLRKYKQVKFGFCFDKDTILDNSFRGVKQLFERLAYPIKYEKLKKCSQSFMILILHKMDRSFIEIAKGRFQHSVGEPNFYKENQQFVQCIYNSTVKQNKLMEINKDLKPEEMQAKKNEFQKIVSQLKPIQFAGNDKAMPISDLFLNALILKSKTWKSLKKSQSENLSKSEVQKTQSSTRSANQGQQNQIQNLFVIWQDIFKQTIKFLIKKLKNPQESFGSFHGLTKFLLDEECEKYINSSQKKSQLCIAGLFSRVLNNLQKIVNLKEKNYLNDFENYQQKIKSVESFLLIFYQNKVFGEAEKVKTLFDSFKIYHELFETLFPIQKMQLIGIPFFNYNDLMNTYICDMSIIVRNFMQSISKIFISQIQVQLNKVKKGQYIELKGLSVPMNKIKQHLEKGISNFRLNDKTIYTYLPTQRILSTIKQYQSALLSQQIQKLSKFPGARANAILSSFSKQSTPIDKQQTLIQLAKTIFDYLDENKLMHDGKKVPLEIKKMLIQMLALEPKERNKVIICYENQFEAIFMKNRKAGTSLSELEAEFVTSFAEYLIKVGLVEKSRQIANLVDQVDVELSKKIMLKSLLKTNQKHQFEFIKNELSSDMKTSLNYELQKNITQINNFFKEISQQVEAKNKQIGSALLDI